MSGPVDEKTLALHLENLRLGLVNTLATKSDLEVVASRIDAYDRGELPNGTKLAVKAIVRSMADSAWGLRSQKAGVLYLVIGVAALCVSLLSVTGVIGS